MTTRLFPGAAAAWLQFPGALRPIPDFPSLQKVGRMLQLCVSVASLVLGLMVLIPVGLAVSPLVLTYSRLAARS